MSPVRIISSTSTNYESEVRQLASLLRSGGLTAASERSELDVASIVRDLLEQVRTGGDKAVAALTSKLDRATIAPESLRVPQEQLQQAHADADPEFLELMRRVIANIREYQEHIRIRAPEPLLRSGRVLGVRYTPMDRIGVYVPGGRALYPSTVLMTVVPAQVAGVREIVIASPPTGGDISPMAMALAVELGVTEVYRMGGAVALGALAFGTESIPSVQKIVGPGNAFVAEAKRQLFGRVGIDSIAGPSEVFIVADDGATPSYVAADLIAQAEHDPGSALLATPSAELAQAVAQHIEQQLLALERREAISAALEKYSALIVTRDLDEACDWANEFATEHLQIITRADARCLQRIRHAGAIFLGEHTPVPVGDYFAGPSHVLPTGGTARQFGPLSCNEFVKATSLIHYERSHLTEDGPLIESFARREGLTAHAAAVAVRRRSS